MADKGIYRQKESYVCLWLIAKCFGQHSPILEAENPKCICQQRIIMAGRPTLLSPKNIQYRIIVEK